MFDMQKIGKRISDSRKAKNMTQMELADIMGVSFQAVSNWERGNSMPDISKLPTLAQVLNIKLDDLLGDEKTGKLAEKIAEDKDGELISFQEGEVTTEAFTNLAPILKPKQAERIFDQMIKEKEKFSLEQLVQLAPFLDSDVLGKLALEGCEGGSMKTLVALAPFMDGEDLGKVAKKIFDGGDMNTLVALAPFMDEDDLGELALKATQGKNLHVLTALAPFLDEDILGKIVNGSDLEDCSGIESLYPFMKEDDLGKLADRLFETKTLSDMTALFPFLEDDKLNQLAAKSLKRDGIQSIVPIIPFLDGNEIGDAIREQFGGFRKDAGAVINDISNSVQAEVNNVKENLKKADFKVDLNGLKNIFKGRSE